MHGHAPQVTLNPETGFLDVDARDVDAIRDLLFRHGIHATVSFDSTGRRARMDVSDVGCEWVLKALHHWRH